MTSLVTDNGDTDDASSAYAYIYLFVIIKQNKDVYKDY